MGFRENSKLEMLFSIREYAFSFISLVILSSLFLSPVIPFEYNPAFEEGSWPKFSFMFGVSK